MDIIYAMDDLQKERLALFMANNRPDSTAYLSYFLEEIVVLHFAGYTLKSIHRYLSEHGVSCSYVTFQKWVKSHVDFERLKSEYAASLLRPVLSGDVSGSAHASASSLPAPSAPVEPQESPPAATGDEQSRKDELARKVAAAKEKVKTSFGKTPKELVEQAKNR